MFPTFATRRLREILAAKGGREMAGKFILKMPDFHVAFRDLLHVVNLRHGNHSITSVPKEGVLRIFFALKNPTASAGFEPANLGTKGQHAISRPPKPLLGAFVVTQLIITMFQMLSNQNFHNRIYKNIQTLS
jgi:hypothetical protein